MRFGEGPESDNFEDRTGQSGGGGMYLGGPGFVYRLPDLIPNET